MFAMYDPDTAQTDLAVNLDAVAKWLKVAKYKLMHTLRSSYRDGIDFSVVKARKPHVPPGRQGDCVQADVADTGLLQRISACGRTG
jgi:hypothetical protein